MTTQFEADVLPLFEANRSVWLAQARVAALKLGRQGRVVTIDDVRRVCPPPAGIDPRVMGAVFTRSDWEAVGFVNSTRTACHKRPVRLFILRGQAAA